MVNCLFMHLQSLWASPSLSETGGERVDGVGCWLVSVYQLSTSFVRRHQFFRHFSKFLEQQQSKNWRRWFIVEINNQFFSLQFHVATFPSPHQLCSLFLRFSVPLFAATTVLRSSKVYILICWNVSNFITNWFVYLVVPTFNAFSQILSSRWLTHCPWCQCPCPRQCLQIIHNHSLSMVVPQWGQVLSL